MLAFLQVAVVRLLRDRSNLFFLVVFPLLLVLLIGAQFGGGGPVPAVGVVDDAGLAEALAADGVEVARLGSEPDAVAAVEAGTVDAAVVRRDGAEVAWLVAPGGTTVDLQVRVAGALSASDVPARAAAALAAVGVEDPDTAVAAVAAQAPSAAVPVTTVGAGGLADEFAGLGQFDLGASQQLLLFVFITSLTGSTVVIQARRWGVVDRVAAGPTSTATVVAGLALGQLAIALVQALVVVVGSTLLFDVRWGDPLATAAVVLLFSLVATAAGLLLGAVLDDEDQASGIGVPVALVLAAFGGSMLPLEVFPDAVRPFASLTPHAWGNRAFAEIVRRDGGVTDVLPELGVLAAAAAVLGVLAVVLLRRRIAR